ncbi:hypothetical protein BZA05DRAFT_445696 [Tricharina praecox]|uniref:uncharacterized protein n=1 Tax=Tricharina praecox TaxID=43433 RepID=UPI00221EACF4|nr:uncharacterized protein BZA05DRAFT_445696 [Tricharina praecox]KAI5849970.1 hypothetical protein BZA05DRAFT_445696 [Tricharina praecox]
MDGGRGGAYVQTPGQRKANQKFAALQEKKMGKSEEAIKREKAAKNKLSGIWLTLLIFAIGGGLLFEFVRLIWSRFG